MENKNYQDLAMGYYRVGDLMFQSKSEAAMVATKSNEKIEWIFHPEVWRNFTNNRGRGLGIVPLDTLYKERAQQLRDKYDYLILHYSGGSDSHNILMTFLNNGIKLDEVCTFRSETVESKIYTPTTQNKSAENIFSEWDYVTKPSLDWLAAHHPDIKITVTDMFKTPIDEVLNDDTFNNVNQYVSVFELLRRKAYSENQKHLLNQGKLVGNIFGIDKPNITKYGNLCLMHFSDVAQVVLDRLDNTDVNNELFYWSKDMPELPFEQAYRLFIYFYQNPDKRYMIDYTHQQKVLVYRTDEMSSIQKHSVYTTWDHTKFQAGRSLGSNPIARDRDNFYLQFKEFDPLIDRWKYYYNEWVKKTNPEFWRKPLVQVTRISPGYFIGMFD
jgi:hypothetical protein